jgi:hypothetical protein
MIDRELKKPTHKYSANPNSAWDLYNHITLALKDSHPLTYLSDHQKVHSFFVDQFGNLKNVYAPVEDMINNIPEEDEEEMILETQDELFVEEVMSSDFGVKFS